MTEDQLELIEKEASDGDKDQQWFVETIYFLTNEIRKLKEANYQ